MPWSGLPSKWDGLGEKCRSSLLESELQRPKDSHEELQHQSPCVAKGLGYAWARLELELEPIVLP